MDLICEVLYVLAAIATVADFIVGRVEEHKRRRMAAEDDERPTDTGLSNH